MANTPSLFDDEPNNPSNETKPTAPQTVDQPKEDDVQDFPLIQQPESSLVEDNQTSQIVTNEISNADISKYAHYVTVPSTSQDDVDLNIDSHLKSAYLSYAYATVYDRALPSLTDGLKPVQRKILYAMHQLGVTHNSQPKKSARIVGNVIGLYHPHGDQPSYDALVRMAQGFIMRYPLVIGQGNFGSRDGDNPAAMRYTESRLSQYSTLLLSELSQSTVDFIPNYDSTETEPEILPSRLPIILMNGAAGVAVGMACKIPPHNLTEVANAAIYILKSKSIHSASMEDKTSKLMQYIKGPDFPTKAQIITSEKDIKQMYMTGQGPVRLRSKWHIEDMAKGQWRIIITELPYEVSPASVISKLATMSDPKPPKDKKELTAKQKQLKQITNDLIDIVRDESGKEHDVRIVIEPKSNKVDQSSLIAFLLTNTDLETTYSVNMTMIGYDGRSTRKPLFDVLNEWCQFRFKTATRRVQHRYDFITHKIHILEGRYIAFVNIEAVIKVIRESDDPEKDLMDAFNLSLDQAKDILEIKLRQLAKLEGIKIQNDIAEAKEEQAQLKHLLDDKDAMTEMIVNEIKSDVKKYGDDRLTSIEEAETFVTSSKSLANVVDEPITIVLSKFGWLRKKSGHDLDESALSFKDGDSLHTILKTSTINPVVAIDNTGRAYTIPTIDIASFRGDGTPITSLVSIQTGAKITQFISANETDLLMFSTDSGYGFISRFSNVVTKQKSGRAFFKLQDKEALMPPIILKQGDTHFLSISTENKAIMFPIDQIKELPGGRGVVTHKLSDTFKVGTILALGKNDVLKVNGTGRGGKAYNDSLTHDDLLAYSSDRAKKGKLFDIKYSIHSIYTERESSD